MLVTLILSALAGAAVPMIAPKVADFLATSVSEEQMPDVRGLAILNFALALFVASVLLALSGVEPSPILVILGGAIGYFWRELREMLLNRGD